MSNAKLLLILLVILLALLAGVAREFYLCGYMVGPLLGLYLAPALFICSLIIGIVSGLRKSP